MRQAGVGWESRRRCLPPPAYSRSGLLSRFDAILPPPRPILTPPHPAPAPPPQLQNATTEQAVVLTKLAGEVEALRNQLRDTQQLLLALQGLAAKQFQVCKRDTVWVQWSGVAARKEASKGTCGTS